MEKPLFILVMVGIVTIANGQIFTTTPAGRRPCGPEVIIRGDDDRNITIRGHCENLDDDGRCKCDAAEQCPKANSECTEQPARFMCCCYELTDPPTDCHIGDMIEHFPKAKQRTRAKSKKNILMKLFQKQRKSGKKTSSRKVHSVPVPQSQG